MQTDQSMAPDTTASLAGKYLTFQLDREVYGLEILKVREIIGMMNVTVVPRTPEHIRGVINLRGKIIPVVDLRVKFDMNRIEDTEQTCIIVVDLHTDDESSEIGVLVDSVSEVLDITPDQIEPTPSFGADVDADFIYGMAKVQDMVTILLNVESVVTRSDVTITVPQTADPTQDQ